MPDRSASFARRTAETDVAIEVRMGFTESDGEGTRIETGIPFFSHLLQAMAIHGRFGVSIQATGDLEVDEHHLVEDTGLVLGEALRRLVDQHGPVERFGSAVIPMDDALAEIAIDVCGRPHLVFSAEFPQERVGSFPVVLLREFLGALANRAGINIHAQVRYGLNSHHMAEALFKALGVAMRRAYGPRRGEAAGAGLPAAARMSTKGTIA